MQLLTLADVLRIEDADELHFTCSEPALAGPENLVQRAVHLLGRHNAVRRGARIHLEKRIPIRAGLGGGSSDAAAALTALNEFWDIRLRPAELASYGAQLGSDVPFFLNGPHRGGAWSRRRGDVVVHHTPCYLVLAKPSAGLSTAQVYANLHAHKLPLGLNRPPRQETQEMLHALESGDIEAIARALRNDLEKRCPVAAAGAAPPARTHDFAGLPRGTALRQRLRPFRPLPRRRHRAATLPSISPMIARGHGPGRGRCFANGSFVTDNGIALRMNCLSGIPESLIDDSPCSFSFLFSFSFSKISRKEKEKEKEKELMLLFRTSDLLVLQHKGWRE